MTVQHNSWYASTLRTVTRLSNFMQKINKFNRYTPKANITVQSSKYKLLMLRSTYNFMTQAAAIDTYLYSYQYIVSFALYII